MEKEDRAQLNVKAERFKMVSFPKDNERRSVWDSTGSTKPNQTKLQKQNYQ